MPARKPDLNQEKLFSKSFALVDDLLQTSPPLDHHSTFHNPQRDFNMDANSIG